MSGTERKMIIACITGVFIYLLVTLFFLSQTSCGTFQLPDTVQYQKIVECTQIAQNCMDDISEAQETGDDIKIALSAGRCSSIWQAEGCTDLVEDLAEQIEAAKKNAK